MLYVVFWSPFLGALVGFGGGCGCAGGGMGSWELCVCVCVCSGGWMGGGMVVGWGGSAAAAIWVGWLIDCFLSFVGGVVFVDFLRGVLI